MNKQLSQEEIDSIVEALEALKEYADDNSISTDLLNNQVVLSQGEIDNLIDALNGVKDLPIGRPDVNVSLNQSEIDALIDALNSFKEYGQLDELNSDMLGSQTVMSQEEIDDLINKLISIKK